MEWLRIRLDAAIRRPGLGRLGEVNPPFDSPVNLWSDPWSTPLRGGTARAPHLFTHQGTAAGAAPVWHLSPRGARTAHGTSRSELRAWLVLQNKPLRGFRSHLTFVFAFAIPVFVCVFSGPHFVNRQMVAALISDLRLDVYGCAAKLIVCHH